MMAYECPDCRYRLTDAERLQARVDFACRRCRNRTISEFYAVDLDGDEYEERESNP